MISTPPRPDDPGESGELEVGGSPTVDEWTVAGSAGRGAIGPEEVDRASRTYWEAEAEAYQAEHGAFLAHGTACAVDSDHQTVGIDSTTAVATAGAGFVWGPEGVAEDELAMLGPVGALSGRRVLEVGCGAAQCSAWLAQRGAQAVGIDIAVNQLRHAPGGAGPRLPPKSGSGRTLARRHGTSSPGGAAGAGAGADAGVVGRGAEAGQGGGSLAVVAASATALPFSDGCFDAAFASYGAIQFVADLPRLLAEVRRVLRPGARWVFSVTHPIRWAFPDDPGPAGLSVSGSYFDRDPYVERDGSGAAVYAEFHRTIGEYVAALRTAGFSIEQLVEPEWPEWNEATWGGWSPLRGRYLPGTLILACRAEDQRDSDQAPCT